MSVKRYKMAAAYAGPVVALDEQGNQFTGEQGHLPAFVLASDYDAKCAEVERLREENKILVERLERIESVAMMMRVCCACCACPTHSKMTDAARAREVTK